MAPALSLLLFAAAALPSPASPPSVDATLPAYRPDSPVHGNLTVARSASTESLVATWITEFSALEPGVRVDQTKTATDLPAECMAELVRHQVQLAPFVREIQPSELAAARAKLGYEPLGIATASGSYATPSNTHAIAIYVNRANPLARMTLTQLDAIYSATRKRGAPNAIKTWGQLGLSGEWKDRPIHAYGMVIKRKVGNPHAGIVAYLMERLMLGGEFDPATLQVPDTGMGRGNNRALDEITDAVASDPAAIGYSGFANSRPNTKTLALAESESGPWYEGTRDQVANRLYPLTRTIFIYVLRPPGSPLDPAAAAFLRFVLSSQGQEAVAVDPAHFLPLPAAFARIQRAKLD